MTVHISARKYFCRAVVITANMAFLLSPLSALADGYRGDYYRHDGEHEHRWREDRWREEGRGPWRYEPRHGWRFEHRPGIWSPYYVWWLINGAPVLRLAPTFTMIEYPNGYYELRGDGISSPYYWAWVSLVTAPLPPPPEPPPSSPIPPPPMMELPPMAPPQMAPPPMAPTPSGGKEVTGTIVGGILGGTVGAVSSRGRSRTAGVIIGTLLGSLLGHEIGKSLDEADELRAAHVLENNKTGQASSWTNPDNGNQITVIPSRAYQSPSGEYCREYQTDVVIGGQKQHAFGTACRQPDGQWKIMQQ